MHDIERVASGDANAAALADRVMHDAFMAAEHAAVDVDDIAGIGGFRLELRNDVRIFALRYEADVLAVLLVGHREAQFFGNSTGFRLGHAAEREAQIVDLLLRGGEKEIALVLVGIDRTIEGAVRAIGMAADIVACRQSIGAEIAGRLQEVGKLDGLVAGNARDRRLAADIARGERIDHGFAETCFIVEDIMRDAQALGYAACVFDILTGTAGTGTMGGCAMIIELQGDADDIIALAFEDAGHNRRIHAARHGNDDTGVFRSSR